MSLLDYLSGLVHEQAQHTLKTNIGPERCTTTYEATEARSGQHYVQIFLSEMYLRDKQTFLSQYVPAVHSLVQFRFGSQQVQIPNVADMSKIALQTVDGSTGIVARNFALTPPVPFNGGDISLEAGMMSVQVGNTLAKYLKTLSDFGALLNVPQLSTVLKIADPLALGIQDLLGQGSGRLHVGFRDTYAARNDGELGNPLRQGYIAVIDVAPDKLDKRRLFVHEDALHFGDDITQPNPLTGYDYVLFRIDIFSQRNDWEGLTFIDEPWQQAVAALNDPDINDPETGKEKMQRALLFLRQAQLRALSAPDLTTAHRRIVAQRLRERFDELKQDIGVLGFAAESKSLLKTVMAGVAQEDITAAASDADMEVSDAFIFSEESNGA